MQIHLVTRTRQRHIQETDIAIYGQKTLLQSTRQVTALHLTRHEVDLPYRMERASHRRKEARILFMVILDSASQ